MKLSLLIPALWRLFRGTNLLILTLLFLLIRHTVTLPLLEFSGTPSVLSEGSFRLIMIATVLIAAAGNIINDLFDGKQDAINKPGMNVIGPVIKENSAKTLYVIFNAAALAAAWIAVKSSASAYLFIIFPLSAGLLFFYSYSYKNIPVLGNIIISVLSSLAVLSGILFDSEAMKPGPVFILVCGYAVFAFLMTMIRELIKDCQDVEGDRRFNSRTLAVVAGTKAARRTAAAISLFTLAVLTWVQIYSRQWENMTAFIYVTLLISIPLAFLTFSILRSNSAKDDGKNSLIAKLIMITGILSMAVFYATF